MNVPEVCWRLQQKRLQRQEAARYGRRPVSVADALPAGGLRSLTFDADAIGLNFANTRFGTRTDIRLPGGYDYAAFRKRWDAGFQTDRCWPAETWSYALRYKQRDDIGDARTNWELNRHFQLALLAKAWYVTGERRYADELEELFADWNRRNAFLHGISWTSVMEVAIRLIQWCVALAFLRKGGYGGTTPLAAGLARGALNMAAYVAAHYSRFSSANNHVLVEATALAFAGYGFGHGPWQRLAAGILDGELSRQNYADGVNREVSLHYQTFGMEAYALVMHLMARHGETVPAAWKEMMGRQCEFVAHSMVGPETACEFGDNDEGKVMDLEGGRICHYRYVLQLCSLVTGGRYDDFGRTSETVGWLFTDEELARCRALPLYRAASTRTFPEGGYTFMRGTDGRMVVGIDHAPLGFGSIAAHGHADALSFQLYVDGRAFLGDPGTYIYHCMLPRRNDYRRTANHNTVWAGGEEQSQMMGAFLWGRRAQTQLLAQGKAPGGSGDDVLEAVCTWWGGSRHTRRFVLSAGGDCLTVTDRLEAGKEGRASLMVHPACTVTVDGRTATLARDGIAVRVEADADIEAVDAWYSEEYGTETRCRKLVLALNGNKLTTKVWIEKS